MVDLTLTFVADLYSCASTILIGRLCTFGEGSGLDGNLSATWELCLHGLSRYTGVSSSSRKSLFLLQEYARNILPNEGRQKVCPERRASEISARP